jgi:hypothetical protein
VKAYEISRLAMIFFDFRASYANYVQKCISSRDETLNKC